MRFPMLLVLAGALIVRADGSPAMAPGPDHSGPRAAEVSEMVSNIFELHPEGARLAADTAFPLFATTPSSPSTFEGRQR